MNSDVTTWALPEGAIARLGRGDVSALAFSPDKTRLAVGSSIGLWLYDMSTQEPIALWDTERGLICDVAFSLNRKWLSTYNLDGVVKVWDIQRGECVTRLELEDRISNIVFSPDSHGLAIAYLRRPRVEIRHPKTGELRAKFSCETEENGYSCIAFSPDARFLAAAKSVDRDSDAERIEVWDIARGQQIAHLTGHTNGVRRISFSPCSRFLASGGQADGTVRVWEVENGQFRFNTTLLFAGRRAPRCRRCYRCRIHEPMECCYRYRVGRRKRRKMLLFKMRAKLHYHIFKRFAFGVPKWPRNY